MWEHRNVYRLLIGEYSIARSGGGMMMMPSGGGTFSTPGGPVAMPVTYSPMYFRGSGSGSIHTYFYGALLKEHLLIAPAETAACSVFDKIDERVKSLNKEIKLGGQGVIVSPEGAYLLYLNKKERFLTVEEFK